MPLLSSEMEEEIPPFSFAMHRTMDPSHHDDSDISYSTPKERAPTLMTTTQTMTSGFTLGMAEMWCAKNEFISSCKG